MLFPFPARLPVEMGSLVWLRRLYLSHNDFVQSLALIELHMDCCRLSGRIHHGALALPDDMGRMKRLRHFYYGCNELADVPESMATLEQLTCLDLHGNRLTTVSAAWLPPGLQLLHSLRISLWPHFVRKKSPCWSVP